MTNEEALDELNVIYERLSHPENCEQGVYSFRDGDYLEALDMAIKALEQSDTLDSIITQIEQARDKDKLCEYPYNRCIDIIKKHMEDKISEI